jgi:hypothetical protein
VADGRASGSVGAEGIDVGGTDVAGAGDADAALKGGTSDVGVGGADDVDAGC